MKPNLKKSLQLGIPLLIGIGLTYYVFKDQDLSGIGQYLKNANKWWLFFVVIASWLSHWLRALRWQLILKSSGEQLKFWPIFHALMFGYLMNLFVPRIGEISRCTALHKTNQVPISRALGTVLAERLLDVICLFLLIGFAILANFNLLWGFLEHSLFSKFDGLGWIGPLTLVTILIFVVLSAVFWIKRQQKQNKPNTILEFLRGLMAGFSAIKNISQKTLFFTYTVGMWGLYFVLIFGSCMALPISENFTLNDSFIIFIMGSLGILAPVQGGIGAYHALVSQTITQILPYGLNSEQGLAIASLSHALPLLVIILMGGISLILILIKSFSNENKSTAN